MHILGERELSYMKPSAVVCNIGRGTAIDTSALAAALAAGRLGGAALDVVEEEPLPADHPLWALPPSRLLLSPHTMDAHEGYWETSVGVALSNLARLRSGEALRHTVDLGSGY